MLTVTKQAVAVLKAAKAAEGASHDAGIRIQKGEVQDQAGITVGFVISSQPRPADEQIEEAGLRIFVEESLREPLDGRTLDVQDGGEEPQLIFR